MEEMDKAGDLKFISLVLIPLRMPRGLLTVVKG